MKRQYKLSSFKGNGIVGYLLLPILFHGILTSSNAQSAEEKAQNAFAIAVNQYDTEIGKNSFLYTGSSYYDPYGGVKGHQFFKEDFLVKGKVNYENNLFDDIYLKYDVHTDQLLAGNFDSNGKLYLIKLYGPGVSYFNMQGYDFIRLEKDTLSNIREGFYNLLYNGVDIQVLVKRRKEIVKSNSIETVGELFIEKDRYYIKKDGLIHNAKNKKSILRVLEDHKKEMKTYIKINGIRFKSTQDKPLLELTEYYDSLY